MYRWFTLLENIRCEIEVNGIHPAAKGGEFTTAFLLILFACQCGWMAKAGMTSNVPFLGFLSYPPDFIDKLYRFRYPKLGQIRIKNILDFWIGLDLGAGQF
jgi:hypothetical protein